MFYTFPGGGQQQYESFREAIVRECLEETGYTVEPVRLAALCEAIFLDEELRRENPGYAHRIYAVFLCRLTQTPRRQPTQMDWSQTGSRWVDVRNLDNLRIVPDLLGKSLARILASDAPLFLGTEYVRLNHA